MIQLRKLRTFIDPSTGKERGYDKVIPSPSAESIQEILNSPSKFLEQLDAEDRYNVFITLHPCDTERREWAGPQNTIAIDIDGAEVSKAEDYHKKICILLALDQNKTPLIVSGNGLHIPIEINKPFTDRKFFQENRPFYKEICNLINQLLERESLPGKADPDMFKPASMLRMPGTENRKAGKATKPVLLIRHKSAPQDFDLKKLSRLPEIPEEEQLHEREQIFSPIDTDGVLKGCDFLKHCKNNSTILPEPEWFAMLSILPRLENGRALAHEYSKAHRGYSFEETETKIEQALAASGPRTCQNINSLWSGCGGCPYFEKVKSPISIKGPDFIETAGSGFHKIIQGDSGKIRKIPCYEDLRRFFEKDTHYKTLGSSEIVYVWSGSHYVEKSDAELKSFAQTHFNPYADTHMVSEFTNLVHRTNLKDPEWFSSSVKNCINFKNGILLENGALIPHSPDYGFRDVLPYNYEPDAKCPNFDKFLDDIMCGDETLKANFLEYTGYALSNDPIWIHKAWVMLGVGENGKSTALDIIRELAGKENYTSVSIGDLKNEGTRQMLDGKYFNISEETPTKALSDSTHFKNLSAGGEINVRQIYKKPYSMRNKAKLIFACNDLPGSTDTSNGFFRRFLIMPFNATFSQDPDLLQRGLAKPKDPFIKDRILGELPGIFNKVRGAYERVKKNREFTSSRATDNELSKFKADVDYTGTWIKENLVQTENEEDYIVYQDLYTSYVQEMEAALLEPLNKIIFGKKHGFQARAKKVNGKSVHVLVKCKLANGALSEIDRF